MRIAFIAANEGVPWGGSELCWAAAAESLAKRGVEVSISAKKWAKPIPKMQQLQMAGCRFSYRANPTLLRRVGQRVLLRRPPVADWIQQVAENHDLIVISQGGTRDGLGWMEEARSQGFPYAIISQAASEAWWPDDKIAARAAAAYEGARTAYFVSEANIALTRKQYATPLKNARVIRNPFSVRYDANSPWPSDSDTLSLACVARLDLMQKAQDLLIDVLRLPHWRVRNVRIVLAGSGVNERSLRELVRQSGLANVEFAGFVDDIESFWGQHHALILPSRFEGMPLALVEAMLCGRPCIVTDVGGNRELVRDNVNGFLAKAPTVELLDEAMNRAWQNRHRLREMGEQAARDVRQWVGPDPVGDFVEELIALVDERHR